MNEKYVCPYCKKGEIRPIQFSLNQAVVNCDNSECESYLEKWPWECIVPKAASEASRLCKYDKESDTSSDSSGVHSDLGSSNLSQSSITDREVEQLLLHKGQLSYSYFKHPQTLQGNLGQSVSPWLSSLKLTNLEPLAAPEEVCNLANEMSSSHQVIELEQVSRELCNEAVSLPHTKSEEDKDDFFEMLKDISFENLSSQRSTSAKHKLYAEDSLDQGLDSWFKSIDSCHSLVMPQRESLNDSPYGTPSKTLIPSLTSAFSEISPSKLNPKMNINSLEVSLHKEVSFSSPSKSIHSFDTNFLSPASSGYSEDNDHTCGPFKPPNMAFNNIFHHKPVIKQNMMAIEVNKENFTFPKFSKTSKNSIEPFAHPELSLRKTLKEEPPSASKTLQEEENIFVNKASVEIANNLPLFLRNSQSCIFSRNLVTPQNLEDLEPPSTSKNSESQNESLDEQVLETLNMLKMLQQCSNNCEESTEKLNNAESKSMLNSSTKTEKFYNQTPSNFSNNENCVSSQENNLGNVDSKTVYNEIKSHNVNCTISLDSSLQNATAVSACSKSGFASSILTESSQSKVHYEKVISKSENICEKSTNHLQNFPKLQDGCNHSISELLNTSYNSLSQECTTDLKALNSVDGRQQSCKASPGNAKFQLNLSNMELYNQGLSSTYNHVTETIKCDAVSSQTDLSTSTTTTLTNINSLFLGMANQNMSPFDMEKEPPPLCSSTENTQTSSFTPDEGEFCSTKQELLEIQNKIDTFNSLISNLGRSNSSPSKQEQKKSELKASALVPLPSVKPSPSSESSQFGNVPPPTSTPATIDSVPQLNFKPTPEWDVNRNSFRNKTVLKGGLEVDPWSVPEVYLDELNIEVILKSNSSSSDEDKKDQREKNEVLPRNSPPEQPCKSSLMLPSEEMPGSLLEVSSSTSTPPVVQPSSIEYSSLPVTQTSSASLTSSFVEQSSDLSLPSVCHASLVPNIKSPMDTSHSSNLVSNFNSSPPNSSLPLHVTTSISPLPTSTHALITSLPSLSLVTASKKNELTVTQRVNIFKPVLLRPEVVESEKLQEAPLTKNTLPATSAMRLSVGYMYHLDTLEEIDSIESFSSFPEDFDRSSSYYDMLLSNISFDENFSLLAGNREPESAIENFVSEDLFEFDFSYSDRKALQQKRKENPYLRKEASPSKPSVQSETEDEEDEGSDSDIPVVTIDSDDELKLFIPEKRIKVEEIKKENAVMKENWCDQIPFRLASTKKKCYLPRNSGCEKSVVTQTSSETDSLSQYLLPMDSSVRLPTSNAICSSSSAAEAHCSTSSQFVNPVSFMSKVESLNIAYLETSSSVCDNADLKIKSEVSFSQPSELTSSFSSTNSHISVTKSDAINSAGKDAFCSSELQTQVDCSTCVELNVGTSCSRSQEIIPNLILPNSECKSKPFGISSLPLSRLSLSGALPDLVCSVPLNSSNVKIQGSNELNSDSTRTDTQNLLPCGINDKCITHQDSCFLGSQNLKTSNSLPSHSIDDKEVSPSACNSATKSFCFKNCPNFGNLNRDLDCEFFSQSENAYCTFSEDAMQDQGGEEPVDKLFPPLELKDYCRVMNNSETAALKHVKVHTPRKMDEKSSYRVCKNRSLKRKLIQSPALKKPNPSVPEVLKLLRDSGWAVTPCNPVINYNVSPFDTSPTIVPAPLQRQYGDTGSDVLLWSLTNSQMPVKLIKTEESTFLNTSENREFPSHISLKIPSDSRLENYGDGNSHLLPNNHGENSIKNSPHKSLTRDDIPKWIKPLNSKHLPPTYRTFQSQIKRFFNLNGSGLWGRKRMVNRGRPVEKIPTKNNCWKTGQGGVLAKFDGCGTPALPLKKLRTPDGSLFLYPAFIKRELVDLQEEEIDNKSDPEDECIELPDDLVAYEAIVKDGYDVVAPVPPPESIYIPPPSPKVKLKNGPKRQETDRLRPSSPTSIPQNEAELPEKYRPRTLEDKIQMKAQGKLCDILSQRTGKDVPEVVCVTIDGKLYMYHRKDALEGPRE